MSTTTFLDVAGKKTQITIGGQGPPLLYLHSAAGEAEWLPIHEALAREFTVYVPAHPGFALSAGLEQIRDIQDMAWHYVDLVAQLKLDRLPVIGFSLGAWLACELAIVRPHLVGRLALVAAAGLRVVGAPMAEIFIDDLEKLRRLLFHDPESSIAKESMPGSLDDPRIVNWLRAREATARVGWNPYLHNPRLPAHLRRIEAPTLVLWGRQDRVIPLAHGEYYASHIPDARLVVLETCGHMAPLEKPDEVAALAAEFLRGR
jgi:pimeloyl-ACP methyl ester carboxylesterase